MARKPQAETLTVPMAPMIDVVFQLLIFFVLTYREEQPEVHLAVNLPSRGSKAEAPVKDPPPILNVTVQPGQYYLNGGAIGFSSLRDFLHSVDSKDTTVVIQVSRRAKASQVVSVLDACKYANLANLNLMTLK